MNQCSYENMTTKELRDELLSRILCMTPEEVELMDRFITDLTDGRARLLGAPGDPPEATPEQGSGR